MLDIRYSAETKDNDPWFEEDHWFNHAYRKRFGCKLKVDNENQDVLLDRAVWQQSCRLAPWWILTWRLKSRLEVMVIKVKLNCRISCKLRDSVFMHCEKGITKREAQVVGIRWWRVRGGRGRRFSRGVRNSPTIPKGSRWVFKMKIPCT